MGTKKFQESKIALRWMNSAKRDLKTACLNYKHGGFTDTTCYFCHQTVEKALKAYLIAQGVVDFPHTHILPVLLSLCVKENKELQDFQVEIEILDRYYIETKYPADIPIDYPKEEADKAIGIAKEILEFLKGKIAKK